MHRIAWPAVVALGLLACSSPARPRAIHANEPWTPVATYMNPTLSSDNVEPIKIERLQSQHIEWSAGGSLGYTLNVPASRADDARG